MDALIAPGQQHRSSKQPDSHPASEADALSRRQHGGPATSQELVGLLPHDAEKVAGAVAARLGQPAIALPLTQFLLRVAMAPSFKAVALAVEEYEVTGRYLAIHVVADLAGILVGPPGTADPTAAIDQAFDRLAASLPERSFRMALDYRHATDGLLPDIDAVLGQRGMSELERFMGADSPDHVDCVATAIKSDSAHGDR